MEVLNKYLQISTVIIAMLPHRVLDHVFLGRPGAVCKKLAASVVVLEGSWNRLKWEEHGGTLWILSSHSGKKQTTASY